MSRIPYPTISILDDESVAILRELPRNLYHLMATTPGALPGFFRLQQATRAGIHLSPQLRELAILRVGYVLEARYETYHHEGIGRAVGLSETQISAARTGKADGLSEIEAAVLSFAEEMTLGPVGAATFSRLRSLLGDGGVFEAGLTCAFYVMVCRLLTSFDVQLEEVAVDYDAVVKRATLPGAPETGRGGSGRDQP